MMTRIPSSRRALATDTMFSLFRMVAPACLPLHFVAMAKAMPPLRAIWIDDIPAFSADNTGYQQNAFQRGDVQLFPGHWLTVMGAVEAARDLRFRISDQGQIFGTLGDMTDWQAEPAVPLAGHPYLYAVKWQPFRSVDFARPASVRTILGLGAGAHGWTVLSDVNEAGSVCGATAASVSGGVGPEVVNWRSYRAGAWANGAGAGYSRILSGPPSSFANSLGAGEFPFVCGMVNGTCPGPLGNGSDVPRASIATTSSGSVAILEAMSSLQCPDGTLERSAAEAVRPMCNGTSPTRFVGWSVCTPCYRQLSGWCMADSGIESSAATEWSTLGLSSRWQVGSYGGVPPVARMIAASRNASGGSIVSRNTAGGSSPMTQGFPCEIEHAAVLIDAAVGFEDLHSVLPGGTIYGTGGTDRDEGVDPADGVLRQNSRIACLVETGTDCSAARTQWFAGGSRFNLVQTPSSRDPDAPRGVVWLSTDVPGSDLRNWCSIPATDLVCNAPPSLLELSPADKFRVNITVTAVHDVLPSGAMVCLANLAVDQAPGYSGQVGAATVNVPNWGRSGAKLVMLTLFADLDFNTVVNGADLGLILGAWGTTPSSASIIDLNGDAVVNGADLGLLLGQWTASDPEDFPLSFAPCGHPVTLPAVVAAVQFMGFESLDEFGQVGVMIGSSGFTPLASMAAAIATDIASSEGGSP